eukprot:2601016-Pleurochrysis_carterae.AAC.2
MLSRFPGPALRHSSTHTAFYKWYARFRFTSDWNMLAGTPAGAPPAAGGLFGAPAPAPAGEQRLQLGLLLITSLSVPHRATSNAHRIVWSQVPLALLHQQLQARCASRSDRKETRVYIRSKLVSPDEAQRCT